MLHCTISKSIQVEQLKDFPARVSSLAFINYQGSNPNVPNNFLEISSTRLQLFVAIDTVYLKAQPVVKTLYYAEGSGTVGDLTFRLFATIEPITSY